MMITQHWPVTYCTNLGEQVGLHTHVHVCVQHTIGFLWCRSRHLLLKQPEHDKNTEQITKTKVQL